MPAFSIAKRDPNHVRRQLGEGHWGTCGCLEVPVHTCVSVLRSWTYDTRSCSSAIIHCTTTPSR